VVEHKPGTTENLMGEKREWKKRWASIEKRERERERERKQQGGEEEGK
jgi:hypothetical protein